MAGIFIMWRFDGQFTHAFSFLKDRIIEFIQLSANKLLIMTGAEPGNTPGRGDLCQ
jgi:hypothetical protein